MQLSAGDTVFIEALQKQGAGDDSLSVAWTRPGSMVPEIIGGENLTSYQTQADDSDDNELPDAWEEARRMRSTGQPNQTEDAALLKKRSAAGDADGDGATNQEEMLAGTDPENSEDYPKVGLQWQIWDGVPGSDLSILHDLPAFPAKPTFTKTLIGLDYGSQGNNYVSRARGLLVPPVSGDYEFSLAGQDNCQLWLSDDATSFRKQLIAEVALFTPWRHKDWNQRQRSAPIRLSAGKSYYIEVLHKEGVKEDNLSVGWTVPGIGQTLIMGDFLFPPSPNAADADDDDLPDAWEREHGLSATEPSGVNGAWGDPDHDLLTNFMEWQNGTDPQVADASGLEGFASWESWENLPGRTVNDLTSSRRFPALPDNHKLLSSTEAPQDRGTAYGGRIRGYLRPAVSGEYRFHIAADDQAVLFLSSSAHKFARKPVATSPFWTGEREYVKYPEQTSTPIRMEAGQSYFFEMRYKEDGGRDHASIAWTVPGAETPEIISGSALAAFVQDSEDRDDDELPDEWETSYGIDSKDSGTVDSNSGPWGDPDHDELFNLEEWVAGTSPVNRDTDGDGVPDGWEIHLTRSNPTVADASSLKVFASSQADIVRAVSGVWARQGNVVLSAEQTGTIDWPFHLSSPSTWFFRISATGVPLSFTEQDSISVAVDGVSLGIFPLRPGGDAGLNVALGRLPFLAAGDHALTVKWASPRSGRRLAVHSLQILSFAAEDGSVVASTSDLAKSNHLVERPRESVTSPVCLEGVATWSRLVTLSTGDEVLAAPDSSWFANVELPDDGTPLPVAVDFENGGAHSNIELAWVPFNVLASSDFTLRAGDALRLTAHTEGESGIATITVNGEITAEFNPARPVEHVFSRPGVYSVSATFIPNAGSPVTRAIQITAIAMDLGQDMLVFAGRPRTFTTAAVSEEIRVVADSSLYWQQLDTPEGQGQRFVVERNSPGSAPVIARLPEGGPILDQMSINAVALHSSLDTGIRVAAQYADGTTVIEMDVFVPELPEGGRVRIDIRAAGVTFEDGSLTKWLTAADFDANGVARVRFVRAPGVQTSICHVVTLWQGTELIGNF